MPQFTLGKRSRAELVGVHPDLVRVVEHAIRITPIDFSVIDGVRTLDEQRAYVASGASRTMHSRHLTGHAVDLAAYVGNKIRWEQALLCSIAIAMRDAARAEGVPLRWGGCWSPLLTDSDLDPEDLIAQYIDRKRRAAEKPFVDAPHYELPSDRYPA
jgi:hypothetical protein